MCASFKLFRMQKRKGKTGWEATKALSRDIANASLEAQADWLWESFAHSTGSTSLERAGLEGESFVPIHKWLKTQQWSVYSLSLTFMHRGCSEKLCAKIRICDG